MSANGVSLLRAGTYVRVSSEEQVDGFSLDAQRRVLLDHCASRGWQVVREYADEGKSARGDQIAHRPAFRQMIEDAEAGLLDIVVVHKLDRFARNMRVTLEYLELLDRHNVRFVAVAQDFDLTRPEGRMFMGLLASLAQYYSDNLSLETKKGKSERKAQGLYNGHLPFGMIKGEDGAPVPDSATIEGLRLAFKFAADGCSDRTIAQHLNAAGYRTTGTHGANVFSKDTVRALLQNRFYLGELPGERPASASPVRHQAVIEHEIWEAAQEARERRATTARGTVPRKATTYSLSGLGICAQCGSTIHIQPGRGRPRAYCSGRRQGHDCSARSTVLATLEQQISAYLATFHIPPDFQERLRAYVAQEATGARDAATQRSRMEAQLARLKDLYVMGDIDRQSYLSERDELQRELALLDARERGNGTRLTGLATILNNVAAGWEAARPEQRNRMARLLFEEVLVNSKRIEAVKPRPELAGFFLLDFQERAGRTHMYRTGGPDESGTIRRQVAQVA
jgi:site-specific DNA recombinase